MVEQRNPHQEPHVSGDFDREIKFRALGIFTLFIVGITVIAFVSMWYFGGFLKARGDAQDGTLSPLVEPGQTTVPPKPHLQVESYTDWAEMRAHNEKVLRGYSWSDRETGRVRIPIAEAMEQVAKNGLPRFEIVGDGSLETPPSQ